MLLELKTNVQEDCNYTEKMARKIPQFIESYEYLDDKGLLWEMVKMEIRSKKRKDHEKILTQEAERLQKLIDVQPNS